MRGSPEPPTDKLLASGLGTPAALVAAGAPGEWCGDAAPPAERARAMREGDMMWSGGGAYCAAVWWCGCWWYG